MKSFLLIATALAFLTTGFETGSFPAQKNKSYFDFFVAGDIFHVDDSQPETGMNDIKHDAIRPVQKMGSSDTLVVPKLNFDTTGELIITASASSTKNDFDFFVGKWKLHNRTLKKKADGSAEWKEFASTQEMHLVLKGIGNIDNFLAELDGQPYEGMTIRLFNPQTRLWSIYWADSKSGVLGLPPVVGSFENKVGHFFSKDVIDGKIVFTVYRWDARDADNPVWSQALSKDRGKTWEWNWFMYMSKLK